MYLWPLALPSHLVQALGVLRTTPGADLSPATHRGFDGQTTPCPAFLSTTFFHETLLNKGFSYRRWV